MAIMGEKFPQSCSGQCIQLVVKLKRRFFELALSNVDNCCKHIKHVNIPLNKFTNAVDILEQFKKPWYSTGERMSRNAGVELVRLKSLWAVCFVHFGWAQSISPEAFRGRYRNLALFLFSAFLPAVDTMMAISGFFGIKSRGFNARRLSLLWFQVWYFNVIAAGIGLCLGWPNKLKLNEFLLPIATHPNWYVCCYFQAALVFPVANICLRSMEKSQHALLCIGILIYETASYKLGYLPYFISPYFYLGVFAENGHSTRFMVAMYLFSAYFGRYPNPWDTSIVCWWVLSGI
jgi:hypothetical protein